jgi:hypothetical protein
MLLWEGRQNGKPPVIFEVYYDDEEEKYLIIVTRGEHYRSQYLTPKHNPVNGLMNIQDLEKAIKIMNRKYDSLMKVKMK